MGHSRGLLSQIAAHVMQTYPEPEFEYQYECLFANKDRKNQPDIQVWQGKSVVCVVEIGYTRPEKLTYYRKRGVKDIRWYSKAGDLEFAEMPEAVPPLLRRIKYMPQAHDRWYCYQSGSGVAQILGLCLPGDTWCHRLWDGLDRLATNVAKVRDQGGSKASQLQVVAQAFRDESHPDYELFWEHELPMLPHAPEAIVCGGDLQELIYDVGDSCATYWSNGHYLFAVNYCDMCDEHTISYNPWDYGLNTPDHPREFENARMRQVTMNVASPQRARVLPDMPVALEEMCCMGPHSPTGMVALITQCGIDIDWAQLQQHPLWEGQCGRGQLWVAA